MLVLAAVGSALFVVGIWVREHLWARTWRAQQQSLQELRAALSSASRQLARVCEDLFVMQTLLAERNLVDEAALAHGRVRLVEIPRRMARERRAIAQHLTVSPTQLIIEGTEGKIH